MNVVAICLTYIPVYPKQGIFTCAVVLCTESYMEMVKKISSSADSLLPVLRNSGLQSSGPLQLLPKDMLKFFMKQQRRAWQEQGQVAAENTSSSEL